MDSTIKGIDLVKSFESCKLKAYICPAGKLTIGWGHTGRDVTPGMTITAEEAERLLMKDLGWSEDVVEKYVKVPLNAHQFDALTSWVFNHGEEKVKNSTLFKLLNKGQYDAVPAQLARWNKHRNKKTGRLEVSRGLVRRRAAEAALWNDIPAAPPPTEAEKEADPMPQAICPSTPPVADLAKSGTIQATSLGGLALITDIFWGTVTDASKQTAESLDATSSLRDALGLSGKALVYIALACLVAAGARRVMAHFGGKIG